MRVICTACGAKAGTAEWRGGREQLTVVTGRRRYRHAVAVACPRCGLLDVTWDDVEAQAIEAVTAIEPASPAEVADVQPVSLRARPRR